MPLREELLHLLFLDPAAVLVIGGIQGRKLLPPTLSYYSGLTFLVLAEGALVDLGISQRILLCILFGNQKLTKHLLSIVSPVFFMGKLASRAIPTPASCLPAVAFIVSGLGRHNHQPPCF